MVEPIRAARQFLDLKNAKEWGSSSRQREPGRSGRGTHEVSTQESTRNKGVNILYGERLGAGATGGSAHGFGNLVQVQVNQFRRWRLHHQLGSDLETISSQFLFESGRERGATEAHAFGNDTVDVVDSGDRVIAASL